MKRKDLIEGEPCPLCGSIHHPYSDEAFILAHNAENTKLSCEIERLKALKNGLSIIDERIRKEEKKLNGVMNDVVSSFGVLELRKQELNSSVEKKEKSQTDLLQLDNEVKEMKDNFKRMMLHAYQIKFTHPITNKEVNIISRVDQVFDKVI